MRRGRGYDAGSGGREEMEVVEDEEGARGGTEEETAEVEVTKIQVR